MQSQVWRKSRMYRNSVGSKIINQKVWKSKIRNWRNRYRQRCGGKVGCSETAWGQGRDKSTHPHYFQNNLLTTDTCTQRYTNTNKHTIILKDEIQIEEQGQGHSHLLLQKPPANNAAYEGQSSQCHFILLPKIMFSSECCPEGGQNKEFVGILMEFYWNSGQQEC